ncbi:hypothetical protein VNO78_21544 [Psophocarpus tetragonolobus]|uniref:Uncharacterized protein n=1 Tax=Psophocarpus tetragonolobus TaxID=3891 RepID=A0AAN9SCI4_PSOTE
MRRRTALDLGREVVDDRSSDVKEILREVTGSEEGEQKRFVILRDVEGTVKGGDKGNDLHRGVFFLHGEVRVMIVEVEKWLMAENGGGVANGF